MERSVRNGNKKIPLCLYAGGTSKALVFHEKDLPKDRALWRELFLSAMGSPDPKQIDGMGGAVSSTSKIAVVAPSKRPGVDVDDIFFQVGIGQASVSENVNCGNISSCIGPFAIEEGLVQPARPETLVRIYNTNTKRLVEEVVPTENGRPDPYGDARIAGVPGTGAPILVRFFGPGGAVTGKPLPTSKEREEFLLPDGKKVLGSIVDAGGAAVFLRAEDFGLKGTEGIEIGGNAELLEKLMAVRGQAAQRCGLVQRWQDAERLSPAVPDVVLVQGAKDCRALDGTPVQAEEMDILARCFCMGQLHRAFPITTAIALGAAAKIPGTTVQEVLGARAEQEELRIGNLSGVLPLMLQAQGDSLQSAAVIRTARRILEGSIYVAY